MPMFSNELTRADDDDDDDMKIFIFCTAESFFSRNPPRILNVAKVDS